jgi:copper homeostasis protein
VDAAVSAQRAGAQRVELCVQLDEGGTTPPAELIRRTADAVDLPVFVLVRPRGGDFVYSSEEVETTRRDVGIAISAGADGIVTGALTADRRIDLATMEILVAEAGVVPVTFHRAFDFTRNLSDALEDVISLGAARVLTSGGAPSALEGAPVIGGLVAQSDRRIVITAAGGIRERNVRALIDQTGVYEIHTRMIDEHSMARLVAEARGTREV